MRRLKRDGRRKHLKALGLIMAAMFIVTLFPDVSKDKQADAATMTITQTGATTTYVTVKWTAN